MLKFKIAKDAFDKLDDNLKALYTANADGSYYLGVEGAVAKERLDEFRTNNVELQKKLDGFSGIDVDAYKKASETQRLLDEKKLLDAGEVDKVFEQRTVAMKTEHEKTVKELSTKLDSAGRQLDVLIIDNSVRENATKLGVSATAVDDVLLRARAVYRVEEGRAIPKDAQGQTIFGKDGTNPMQISDWIGGLKETAPHLFQASTGSGASGSGSGNNKQAPATSSTGKIAAGLQAGSQILS